MTKGTRNLILADFHRLKPRLDEVVAKTKWHASSIVIPFCTSEGIPVSARYGFKAKAWLEINVISEENVLEYIKLNV